MAVGSRITDPGFIWETLRALLASGEEFPIKVEGTKTLPYAALLNHADAASEQIIVKLMRPLPPALAEGALFEMIFAANGKRYEARIAFVGREGYLQYQFRGPSFLVASDRRVWKRYPIRPREDFQVTAQDSALPGHGFTGPLVNLSMGGLAFRVDRMLRLDDGLPVRPGTHNLEQGIPLSLLRVRGFPKGQVLDARGAVVRVQEAHSELHLGIQFTGLDEPARVLLANFLDARERQNSPSSGTGRISLPGEGLTREATATEEEAPELTEASAIEAPPGPESAGLEALLSLDRRCSRVLLVSPAGEDRARITRRLESEGYWCLETVSDLFEAHTRIKAEGATPIQLLMVDLEPSRAEGLEPVGAVRHLEPLLKAFGSLPVAFVTRLKDPMLELLERPGFGAVALAATDGPSWAGVLDGLLR